MSRKIILIKQELLLLVYELNRSGLLAENEKDRKSGSAGMPRPISYAVFCWKKKKGDVTTVIRFGRSLLSLDRKSSALRLYCAPGVVDAMTINQLPLTFFSTSTYFPASESAREPAL